VEEPVVGFEPDQRDRRLSAALEGETDVARGSGYSRKRKNGQQPGDFCQMACRSVRYGGATMPGEERKCVTKAVPAGGSRADFQL